MADYTTILDEEPQIQQEPPASPGRPDYTTEITSPPQAAAPPAQGQQRPQADPSILSTAARYLDDMARSIAEGFTAGYADEIASVMQTFVQQLDPNVPVTPMTLPLQAAATAMQGEQISKNLAAEEAKTAAVPSGVAIPGQIAGAVAGGIAAAPTAPARLAAAVTSKVPTGIGRAAVRGALGGATGGAAFGSGTATGGPEERLQGAKEGAITGAATGAVAGPLIRGAGKLVSAAGKTLSPTIRAERALAEALEQDGISATAARMRLKRLGTDAFLADVGDENVRALVRSAGDTPGAAKKVIENALRRRAQRQQNRIVALVQRVSSSKNFGETLEEVRKNRQAASTKLYQQAFDQQPIIKASLFKSNPQKAINLQKLMQNPIVKAAIRDSKKIVRRNDDGTITEFKDLPDNSILILDQVYKTLGDRATTAARRGKGAKQFDLNELRGELKDILTTASPAYGRALDTFSSGKMLEEAMDLGRKALDPSTDITPARIAAMPEVEREMFQIGFAQAVQDMVEKVPNRETVGNAARKVFGNPAVVKRIRAALPDDASFREFARGIIGEERFVQGRQAMAPSIGSQTLPRARAAEVSGSLPAEVPAAAKGFALGGPKGAAVTTGAAFLTRLRALSPAQRNEIARIATTRGPEAAQEALDRIYAVREAVEKSVARQPAIGAAGIQPLVQR